MISGVWAELEKEFNAAGNEYYLEFWFHQNSKARFNKWPTWLFIRVETKWDVKSIGAIRRYNVQGWRKFSRKFTTHSGKFKVKLHDCLQMNHISYRP